MHVVFGSAGTLASFDPERIRPRVLFESGNMKVALVALEPGQELPLHGPAVDLAIAVLEGTGEIWGGDGPRSVRAGDVAVIPAGRTRGLRAREDRLVLLHVVAPPPTPDRHPDDHRPWPAAEATGPDPAEAIRAEHEELLPHLGHLAELAEEIADLPDDELVERLRAVRAFLTDVLIAHAQLEEEVLYPAVEPLLRAVGGATRTMSIDHEAIGEMVGQFAELADAQPGPEARDRARSVLHGLATLVGVHFDKEERVYLPVLSRLHPDERVALREALASAPGHDHGHGA